MPSPSPPIRTLRTRIALPDAGYALVDFLTRRFTYLDNAAWREEISAGRVLINHTPADADAILTSGDEVVSLLPEIIEPEVATDYRVVHEDDDLLVLDKPAPLPCHPGGRYFRHTLWGLLKEKHRLETFFFVNRLDRETSGLVLVAKNAIAARHCAKQFASHEVNKDYLVLVEGDFPEQPVHATGWLAVDTESMVRKKMRFYSEQPSRDAKGCATDFMLRDHGNGMSLLVARPRTGRCHQIRATLLALGFPVVGDKLYGVDESFFIRFINNQFTTEDWQRLRIPRQALHASRLTIVHPATGLPLTLTAPLPNELTDLLP
ncbi:MAG TPA: RluA family pseudouridine synthase [Desulfurivibrionaceae bacterium]|nr:RluA family pseudouridine synthase [Desulfurivibrionaceae bacterium]